MMALTADETARLVRLRADREAQIGGRGVAKIASGGRSKEFAQADLDRLEGDIAALEAKALTGRARKRGSITFRFRR